MQTHFTPEQLTEPAIAQSEAILRKCVHCGFCTATCPTYVELGNELDSPRGRIYLIKQMLEEDRPADAHTVKHIDRCLSCMSCMTTCPSGVDYMHLVDHARAHIEKTYKRPLLDRLLRQLLTVVLPYPSRFRAALKLARLGKPFKGIFAAIPGMKPVAAMLALAPRKLPAKLPVSVPSLTSPERGRVAILRGCAQSVLDPEINAATTRLLARFGITVAPAPEEGCCGALVQHMGYEEKALAFAKANVDAWTKLIDDGGLDAIIITASGCGTTIKDYGHMLRLDPVYAEKAARISALTMDITEYLAGLELPEPAQPTGLEIAYHSACSMQHAQKIIRQPRELLVKAGFLLREPREGHLCCGSAGTYNILQPEISERLRARKTANLKATGTSIVATGNIGCMTQLGSDPDLVLVHTVQLLDWAYGGPAPAGLANAVS